MKNLLIVALIVLIIIFGAYFFNQYWKHRYDAIIVKQANIYRLDPDLVWSIIYEETYFRSWKTGRDGEIGLMQVTPLVAREWATQTGMRELERQIANDPYGLLRDPERNIQIGCWYLEKLYQEYRDVPDAEARMVAGYNAGPSRAAEWNRTLDGESPLSAEEFIQRIDIPSTRAYVTSVLERYQQVKESRMRRSPIQRQSLSY